MPTNINVFIPFLSAALTAMRASSVSSASALPRKRGKARAKAPADAPAVGIEGDWRYIPRDEFENTGKDKTMPGTTFDMERYIPAAFFCCAHL